MLSEIKSFLFSLYYSNCCLCLSCIKHILTDNPLVFLRNIMHYQKHCTANNKDENNDLFNKWNI